MVDEKNPLAVAFIMLNPSTADSTTDDQTIRKCIGFTKKIECGRFVVVNLFTLRTKSPAVLKLADDPRPKRSYIRDAIDSVDVVICAWGGHGAYLKRGEKTRKWLKKNNYRTWCLGTTLAGEPRHPLMLAYDTPLETYT
jgi:hypothetical protein